MSHAGQRWAVMLLWSTVASAGCAGPHLARHEAGGPRGQPVDLEVRGVAAPDPRLVVTLSNRSDRELTLPANLLPWREEGALLVLAMVGGDGGARIAHSFPPGGPTGGAATLRPGESLSGSIALTRLFPGCSDALATRDVVLFWSYQLHPLEQEPLPRMGGSVIFTRAVPAPTRGRKPARPRP